MPEVDLFGAYFICYVPKNSQEVNVENSIGSNEYM